MNPVEDLDRLLGEIPHSVQLYDLYKVTNETCKSVLKRLESEEKTSVEDEDECIRRSNFSTILLLHLKQPAEALAKNEMILKKHPQNVTALVNRICIKMATGYEGKAKSLITDLKAVWFGDGHEYLRASAFAGEAYSLSRIHPKFYIRSIKLFQKSIDKFPQNHSWKFGCALSCKRCLSLTRGLTNISSDDLKKFCEMAVSLFYNVATHEDGRLAGLSWAHLGELLNQLKRAAYPLHASIVGVAITLCPLSAENCLIKALQCHESQEDENVLARCGNSLQFARHPQKYESTLQDCYTLLVKANTLRPTSYGCDKLASILLKMVENGIYPHNHSRILCLEDTESGETVPLLNKLNIKPSKSSASPQRMKRNTLQGSQTFKPRSVRPYTRVVNKYPANPLLIQAVEYLKLSLQITEGTNMIAIQNLGMMYRRLNEPDLALATFCKVLSFQEASLYEKVNAYEQIAFCHLDKSENSNLRDVERQSEKEEAKFMMKRAVEGAACLVACLPTMSREDVVSWESYPTLKQLLSNEPRPEHLKDIARLCQLIGNHKEALDWYMQLQEIKPNDVDTLYNVVVTHMQLKDFTTAQNSFNVLMGSSDGRKLLEEKPELFNQVYLGRIRHLMGSTSDEDKNHLKMSCRTIFDYKHRKLSSRTDESDEAYEIYILDDPDETESEAETLKTWLTDTCGLRVTRNDNDVNYGSLSLHAEDVFIRNCRIMIVVLGSGQMNERVDTRFTIAVEVKGRGSVVSIGPDELEVPSRLKGSLSVKRPQEEEGSPEHQRFLLQCFMSTLGLNFETFQWIE